MCESVGIGTGQNGPINQLKASIAGMNVVISPNAGAKYRTFPESRHRSERIRKKLIKRHGSEFRIKPGVTRVHNVIYVHPAVRREFEEQLREQALGFNME